MVTTGLKIVDVSKPFWRNIYLNTLVTFSIVLHKFLINFGGWFLSACKYLLPGCGVFPHADYFLTMYNLFSSMQLTPISIFTRVACGFSAIFKQLLNKLVSKHFSLLSFCRRMASGLTFKSLIHFELIFVHGLSLGPAFVLL